MVLGAIFEMLGAITVGARTADTIKNGIIPNDAFRGNAGVQMLAFTCALAAASSWVMWCTKHSAHVSSTYSLISAVAGVGVATVGAAKVQWGWNGGKGLGAIFAGLGMAPAISGGFAASIFLLIKFIVHARKEPVKWAVYTSPFWFLLAGTICTLSIVYKGSPNLGLNKKPAWYVAAVTMGTGGGVAVLAALFFVPYVYAKVIVKDHSVKWYHVPLGPLLYRRAAPAEADRAAVPNYAVIQDDDEDQHSSTSTVAESVSGDHSEKTPAEDTERTVVTREVSQATYKELVGQAQERLHQKIMKGRGPLAWALRYLRANRMGAGELYEPKNIMIVLKRIPAQIVVGALYGLHYDIHAAQSGIAGTPEGARMARVYAHAEKYPNEVEHTYSFVQVLTACTASFAHGANDIGNSVGPWAVIYSAWSTGSAAASKAPVPIWQLAVLSAAISVGLVTYGYNIMKGTTAIPCQLIQKHFANGSNSHGQQDYLPLPQPWLQHGDGRRYHCPRLLAVLAACVDKHVHHGRDCRCRSLQRHFQGRQLPAGRPVSAGVGHDDSDRGYAGRCVDGAVTQYAALFYLSVLGLL